MNLLPKKQPTAVQGRHVGDAVHADSTTKCAEADDRLLHSLALNIVGDDFGVDQIDGLHVVERGIALGLERTSALALLLGHRERDTAGNLFAALLLARHLGCDTFGGVCQ